MYRVRHGDGYASRQVTAGGREHPGLGRAQLLLRGGRPRRGGGVRLRDGCARSDAVSHRMARMGRRITETKLDLGPAPARVRPLRKLFGDGSLRRSLGTLERDEAPRPEGMCTVRNLLIVMRWSGGRDIVYPTIRGISRGCLADFSPRRRLHGYVPGNAGVSPALSFKGVSPRTFGPLRAGRPRPHGRARERRAWRKPPPRTCLCRSLGQRVRARCAGQC